MTSAAYRSARSAIRRAGQVPTGRSPSYRPTSCRRQVGAVGIDEVRTLPSRSSVGRKFRNPSARDKVQEIVQRLGRVDVPGSGQVGSGAGTAAQDGDDAECRAGHCAHPSGRTFDDVEQPQIEHVAVGLAEGPE